VGDSLVRDELTVGVANGLDELRGPDVLAGMISP
jgi:hypothetical protein